MRGRRFIGGRLDRVALAACLVLLSACQSPSLTPSARSENESISPHFGDFTDIPRPANASMDLDRTLVLGAADTWVGRLAFSSRLSTTELFDFYKQEMPRYGWEEVTSVRSTVSVLTYKRMERVSTLQIRSGTIIGSYAELTVSPQGTSAGYSPGASQSGVTSKPLAPVGGVR
ncbi:MAG: hypothetical protein HQL45_02740 [Alphaproteobacteria bacterium]|nr:hypothetical protein [Alphaproteobacteria bacterium]MBF0355376.1 hypothetical protein [Alphaproteobacteria bacterium]